MSEATPCPLLDDDGENQAVRSFLLLYRHGTPGLTVGAMKRYLKNSGFPLWPTWVEAPEDWMPNQDTQHLTKAGAQSWIRYLFSLETAATSGEAAVPVAKLWLGTTDKTPAEQFFPLPGMMKLARDCSHDLYVTAPALQQEGGQDAKDVARYRWLRDHSAPTMDPADDHKPWCARRTGSGRSAYNEPLWGDELDAAVDDAIYE